MKIDFTLGPPEILAARRLGVGGVANKLLLRGHTNLFVLAALRAVFPEHSPSPACVRWYRSKLRQAGCPVMTSQELVWLKKRASTRRFRGSARRRS